MKRLLLIDPVYNPGTIPPNVPISKIAAGLQACDIEIKVVDFLRPDCEGKSLSYFQAAEKEFLDWIANMAADCDAAYITSGTGTELKPYPLFPRIKAIAQRIKSVRNIPVIVGGALMNLYVKVYQLPLQAICEDNIDHIVVGNEYHGAMKLLVGSTYPQSVVPLWSIWDRSHYPDYKSVQYHTGCPYSCDFCFEGKIYNPKSEQTNVKDFQASVNPGEKFVVEDSVLMSYRDFDEIMNNFQSKNVRFSAYARISEIVNAPEKVERMRRAGCQAVIVGIETLDSEMLKGHNKNIVSSDTRRGLDILNDHGIQVQGCFMLGFPEDSLANMERTIEFAVKENLNGYRWHIYQPNYSQLSPSFYSKQDRISVLDHLRVQLNVPDCCLYEMINENPAIGMMDEHFMIRGKNYIPAEAFDGLGYRDRFSYKDIKDIIDAQFPPNWILNEEELYQKLFN